MCVPIRDTFATQTGKIGESEHNMGYRVIKWEKKRIKKNLIN